MSERRDDLLDAHLAGRSPVSDAYESLHLEPSPEVDAKILAEAKQSTMKRRSLRAPVVGAVALAASVVVVIGIVPLVQRTDVPLETLNEPLNRSPAASAITRAERKRGPSERPAADQVPPEPSARDKSESQRSTLNRAQPISAQPSRSQPSRSELERSDSNAAGSTQSNGAVGTPTIRRSSSRSEPDSRREREHQTPGAGIPSHPADGRSRGGDESAAGQAKERSRREVQPTGPKRSSPPRVTDEPRLRSPVEPPSAGATSSAAPSGLPGTSEPGPRPPVSMNPTVSETQPRSRDERIAHIGFLIENERWVDAARAIRALIAAYPNVEPTEAWRAILKANSEP
ncbi:MAG: hypothetical protein AAF493_03510 [Pseudomonadota bacterium]